MFIGFAVFENSKLYVSASSYTSPFSESNAPLFYGATEITIDKNVCDNFSIKDSRFRIFAKDFEDGDLTPYIKCTYNNVISNVAGEYEIKYEVVDSHNNTSTITVPVHVLDKEENECKIIRTLYTVPAMSNLKAVATERCNNGDRQILGISLPEDGEAQIKVLSADQNLQITYFANNRAKNGFTTINCTSNEYQTIKNPKKPSTENVENLKTYACVPLITSARLSQDNVIDKTYKIEVKFTDKADKLDYYHYKDNEQEFKQNWEESKTSYGVVDGEAIMCVVPFTDVDKLSNLTASKTATNRFKSLDTFFEYYLTVVNRMDKIIGLDFNATSLIDQNFRIKYTAVADAGVNAGAYYADGFIAVCSTSIAPIFEYGWGTLHEIAHGYQGYFGKGTGKNASLFLNETGNNILAHYIQVDRSLYLKTDSYIGELATCEENINNSRYNKILNGKTIFNNDNGTYTNTQEKLYCIVNLLDSCEGSTTYGKMFSYYRHLVSEKGLNAYTIADVYAKFFAKEYNINIIPYLQAWATDVSTEVKREILDMNLNAYTVLADAVGKENLENVKAQEGLSLKYGLVSEEELTKYNLKGNLTINVTADDFNLIKNHNLGIYKNNQFIKAATINNKSIKITDLPIGNYEIKMPAKIGFCDLTSSVFINCGENTFNYTYSTLSLPSYVHLTSIRIYGIYNTVGFALNFKNDYKSGKITLGGADLGNRNTTWANKPNETYISVTIKDNNNKTVKNLSVKGNQYFNNLSLSNPEITFKTGYKIIVYTPKPNLVKVFSQLTNNQLTDYNYTQSNTITYEVTKDGLKIENIENFNEKDVLYTDVRPTIVNIIEDYKLTVTEEELNNRRINNNKKSEVLNAYKYLSNEDKELYKDFINRVAKGSSPVISVVDANYSVKFEEINKIFSFITITDVEDYFIPSTAENVKLTYSKIGKDTYNVTYHVVDSDGNISTTTIPVQIIMKNTVSINYWAIALTAIFAVGYIIGIIDLIKKNKPKAVTKPRQKPKRK